MSIKIPKIPRPEYLSPQLTIVKENTALLKNITHQAQTFNFIYNPKGLLISKYINMPVFSRFHTPTSVFPSDAFRLLDELNQSFAHSVQRSPADGGNRRAFSPNFDVHENEMAFVLEGELPGLEDKSKVNIEFTDGNTLLVRGKIEKSSVKTSEPTTANENAAAAAPTEESQVAKHTDKSVGIPADGVRYWVSERTVGEFQRSFSFPGAVDIDAVTANFDNGILKIVVPKKELAKGRKIEIF